MDSVCQVGISLFALPGPADCLVYYVSRDMLFSYRKFSEFALSRIIRLGLGCYGVESGNGLLHLADLPARRLLVLIPNSRTLFCGDLSFLCSAEIHLEGFYVAWRTTSLFNFYRGDFIA